MYPIRSNEDLVATVSATEFLGIRLPRDTLNCVAGATEIHVRPDMKQNQLHTDSALNSAAL
eukprot:3073678-Amphidinium_carterae.1